MSDEQAQYAGFWRRWAAWTLDTVIVGYFSNYFYFAFVGQLQMQSGLADDPVRMIGIARIYQVVFSISLGWAYFAGMESSPLQATVGKLTVGLFVTQENGERISFGQATGRFFGKIISSLTLCIGFMMAGWTSRKQALHDIMAGTFVHRK